jgi:hypothetical protein
MSTLNFFVLSNYVLFKKKIFVIFEIMLLDAILNGVSDFRTLLIPEHIKNAPSVIRKSIAALKKLHSKTVQIETELNKKIYGRLSTPFLINLFFRAPSRIRKAICRDKRKGIAFYWRSLLILYFLAWSYC